HREGMTKNVLEALPRDMAETAPASHSRKKNGAPYGNKYGVGGPGGGRKSKYNPSMIITARQACKRGFTDVEIADLFGVTESTLKRWKRANPAFAHLRMCVPAASEDNHGLALPRPATAEGRRS